MHPRLPREGNLHACFASISLPYRIAGGPARQSPLQSGPSTHGSLLTHPLPVAALGSAHGGGSAGSGNAGVGKSKPGQRRQLPNLCRHPKQRHGLSLQFPSANGDTNCVVVGRGANRQLPVPSIAGKRSWLQPLQATKTRIIHSENPRSLRAGTRCWLRRSSMIAVKCIVPSGERGKNYSSVGTLARGLTRSGVGKG